MNKQTPTLAQIRRDIEEALCPHTGLGADISAIDQLALLLAENHDCNPQSLSRILQSLVADCRVHLTEIEDYTAQLKP